MKVWTYRPTEEEDLALAEAMREGDYPSVASFVREGVLRLIHVDQREPLFSCLYDQLRAAQKIVKEVGDLRGKGESNGWEGK